MEYTLELIKDIANQQFFTVFNNNKIDIRLRTFRSVIYVDISINGELVVSGTRAVNEVPLIPLGLSAKTGCTLYFKCQKGDYPVSSEFDGMTSVLILKEV